MEIKAHHLKNTKIAEVISAEMLIKSAEDGLDLLGNIYYQGFDKVIIYERNVTPEFFDLKNKLAGEILQKFSNYRVRLAIIGDFDKFESNKTKHINFVGNLAEALEKLV